MGDVAVTLRVMPSGTDVDLEQLKKAIENEIKKEGVQLRAIEEKPVAFGLKAIEILLVMPDSAGFNKIEDAISKISGVESIEAGDTTLL